MYKTKEVIEVYDEWYQIPGFSSYDIGKNTKYVRSHKHFKSDSHHIMKSSLALPNDNPSIQMTDDAGVSRWVKREFLYDKTFNMGYLLKPRNQEEVYKGGMVRTNRYMKGDVQLVDLNKTYADEVVKYGPEHTIERLPVSLVDQQEEGTFTLDFSKPYKPKMIKPFTYDYSLNN